MIKWNSTPPTPLQIKDEAAYKPKRAIFPSLIWGKGGGGGEGTNFPSILSKIEGMGRNFSGKTLFFSCVCCQIYNTVNLP